MAPKKVSPWRGNGERRVVFLMREESGISEAGIENLESDVHK